MRKKVLLVEKSDAVRGAAEAVLRHNGYEVIALSDPEKALEVVSYSRPDLMLAGSNLVCRNGKPFYERLQADIRLAGIPLLLFAEHGEANLPFPDEVVLYRPLDPKEFAEKVGVFMGPSAAKGSPVTTNPLGGANLDDDFLDAALGLDRLDVVQSEIMDNTVHTPRAKERATVGNSIGFDHDVTREDDQNESRRVESVVIRDENSEIMQRPSGAELVPDPSASGRIEILSDQYGMANPAALDSELGSQTHDYDWFVDEMQRDALATPAQARPGTPSHRQPVKASEVRPVETAAKIDPFRPPSQSATPPGGEMSGGGVDKFIDEFKKEVEKFHSAAPENVVTSDAGPAAASRSSRPAWEDNLESITAEQVGLFTRQLAYDLAERIAVKIVNKIDTDKLLNLIKSEILTRAEKNTKGAPR